MTERADAPPPNVSVVIPFMNEQETLGELHRQIVDVLVGLGKTYEIIFIDDGSTDESVTRVQQIMQHDPHVALIQFRGNFGKSAALSAGFAQCTGDIVFTMDADLQDDPQEIPRFLDAIEKDGCDLVSGYKQTRHDPWHKVLPSRVFNAIVRTVSGIKLHDVNCGFKCYRREVIEEIQVYGSMHRFIPVLAHWRRFRIGELIVKHHPRRFGVSKFGIGRFYEGLTDLLTVTFLMRYERRPAHFFGRFGLVSATAGFLCCLYLSILWLMGYGPIGNRPLLFLGILLLIVGVQFFATGLIAELLSRSTLWQEKPFAIRRHYGKGAETPRTVTKPEDVLPRIAAARKSVAPSASHASAETP